MRRDKHGHVWKWNRNCSGHGVCPFCGIERKLALRGPKGAKVEGFRPIGSSGPWCKAAGRCRRLLRLGGVHALRRTGGRLKIERVTLAWPPRLECRDKKNRKVVVPVLAYWRARRAR